MTNDKKAQQEILGFVIIIMIVVVIGVIFLGISLQKQSMAGVSSEDAEIANYLSSSMGYTSDCMIREPFYASLKELIESCSNGELCSDKRRACDVLNKTYAEMTAKLWPAAEDRPIKYTKLDFTYQEFDDDGNPSRSTLFLEIIAGNKKSCNVIRSGKTEQAKYPGNLITRLEVCR